MATALELLSTIYELIQGGATAEEAVAYATTGNETDKEYEHLKDQAQQFFDKKNKDEQESKNNDPFAQHDQEIDDKPYKKRKSSFNNLPRSKQAKVTDTFKQQKPMSASNPKRRNPATMEDQDGDVVMEAASVQTASAGTKTGNTATRYGQETPVTIPPTITYGLQDTHTTILPFTFYGCAGTLSHGSPTKLKLRCNSPYNCVETDFLPGTGSITINSIYNKFISSTITSTWIDPPTTYTNGVIQGERPAYLKYWSNYYDYYTVLGMEIHMVVQNANTDALADAICVVTESGTQDPPSASLDNVMYWKQKSMHLIEACNPGSRPDHSATIIEKSWKPGQFKREVRDDDKSQVWTQVNNIPPLNEHFNFWFYRAPIFAATSSVAVNFMCTIKYIVQFKDPKSNVHYPLYSSTTDPFDWAPRQSGAEITS